MPSFVEELISWWRLNGRSFPWRTTDDPYRIFVAEVLLHRTRADSTVPVYLELINAFPTVAELSCADENTLLTLVSPLGLRWRTKMLLEASKIVMDCYGGAIPVDKNKLLQLPGVGEYITSAVRTFSSGIRDPLIDVNTVRIISRIHGVVVSDSARRTSRMRRWYLELLDKEGDPRIFGYAMIDLASRICRPHNPKCELCPVMDHCSAGKSNGWRTSGPPHSNS